MSNEFFARKGLAIATSSVSSTSSGSRFLVLGDDNIVRFRTDVTSGGAGASGSLPYYSIQLSSPAGLTGYGIISNSTGNIIISENGSDVVGTIGACNTFVGVGSGTSSTNTAAGNSFYGYRSGFANTSGTCNTFLGYFSGNANTSGCNNTYVGYQSGQNQNTQCQNTFIGFQTGQTNTTSKSTLIGSCAGQAAQISSTDIVAVGNEAGKVAGSFTVYVGSCAGLVSTGQNNVYIGHMAGKTMTTGVQNVYIGSCAGTDNGTTQQNNVYIGYGSGWGSTGACNTFLGSLSGCKNTSGPFNTFIGAFAGHLNTTACQNTFVGAYAGCCNTTQCQNTYIGSQAGRYSTGAYNTLLGSCAGIGPSTGSSGGYNVYVGFESGECTTSGCQNVYSGFRSGCCTTTGCNNVYVGMLAGATNSIGRFNTFVGFSTGMLSTSAERNVFIGNEAGYSTTTATNSVYIGNGAGYSGNYYSTIAIGSGAQPTSNNQLVIASSENFIGTASAGTFSHFLNIKVNGVDLKIPLYS
jgi:hypothetical protein